MGIQTLNLSQLQEKDSTSRDKLCENLLDCFRFQGMIKVTNHGISDEVIEDAFERV